MQNPFRSVENLFCLAVLFAAAAPQLTSAAGTTTDTSYDLLIKGGRIVDGTGAPWYVADVGIRNGIIADIGHIEPESAQRVINADGLIVAPGFIDMMGQSATPLLEDPQSAINLLTQGITTINAGEGSSAAPLNKAGERRFGWRTMAEYFQLLEMKGLPVNVVQTVGHTQVRRMVLGEVDRRPSDAEIGRMRELVRESMEAGAIGVSTALIYPPAVFATTEEIAKLAEVAGQYGGRYYTHLRNEGDQLLPAIDEALDIGRMGKTPVHIFHLKAAGRRNWGKMQLALAKIQAARTQGQQVTADIYPYVNNGLGIESFIHPRHFGQGRAALIQQLDDPELRATIRREMESVDGWENWFRHVGKDWEKVIIGRADHPRYQKLAGQSVATIASETGEDVWDTFFQLVRAGAFALPESMTDANKILALRQEYVSFCTDVGPAGGARSASHPRACGAFPRLLSRYVRDLGAISLERAVAQASAVAANEVMAYDRGRIAEGLAADIIAFDYELLADKATFSAPNTLAVGMRYVVVNGVLVLENDAYNGRRPGRVLRGPGHSPATAPRAVTTGLVDERLQPIDDALKAAITKHRIVGAAVAITDSGRLVHARGYGYADLATRDPVLPTSLFRIASISKPITAVAILQLIDQKKLSLDDKVLEILHFEPHERAGAGFDDRQRQITIRHLLQHRGGWDRDVSLDAMFQSVKFAQTLNVSPPANPETIIRVMLGRKLDFDPGYRYAYSNFGYCLLGRVIEKLSDQTYESYVQKHVFEPLDIRSMRIGSTRLEGRHADEVRYYHPESGTSVFADDVGQQVPQPYGAWYLEAMDSHGAWIASAIDLARFACAFDDGHDCPLLSSALVDAMFQRPPGLAGHDTRQQPKNHYYGLGWAVDIGGDGQMTTSHRGSLPGTNTSLIRRSDGRNVVILLNSRVSPLTTRLVSAVTDDVQAAMEEVEEWPERNLFDE